MEWLTVQRLSYSTGWRLTPDMLDRIGIIPERAWAAAVNNDGSIRNGAWVVVATGVLDLTACPKKGAGDRPRRTTTSRRPADRPPREPAHRVRHHTTKGQHATVELRHRLRARCGERIRAAKDTGLRNLPLHDFAQNQIWAAAVMLAGDLIAWTQMPTLAGTAARTWEPKRLRHRVFSIAGKLGRRNRRTWLSLSDHAPHVSLVTAGLSQLQNLPQLS